MMDLIRPDSAVLLDSAMSEADELVAYFVRLESRFDAARRQLLADAAQRHETLLERLRDDRRSHDDMPAVGDPERAELRALATSVQGVFASLIDDEDTESVVTDAVIEASQSSIETFRQIPSEVMTQRQAVLVAEYLKSCEKLIAELRSSAS